MKHKQKLTSNICIPISLASEMKGEWKCWKAVCEKICTPYLWLLIFCYLCTWKARDKQFMATSKHASIRYEVLDRYLQRQSEDNTEKNSVSIVVMPLPSRTPDMRPLRLV